MRIQLQFYIVCLKFQNIFIVAQSIVPVKQYLVGPCLAASIAAFHLGYEISFAHLQPEILADSSWQKLCQIAVFKSGYRFSAVLQMSRTGPFK